MSWVLEKLRDFAEQQTLRVSTSGLPEGAGGSGAVCGHPGTQKTSHRISERAFPVTGTDVIIYLL